MIKISLNQINSIVSQRQTSITPFGEPLLNTLGNLYLNSYSIHLLN